jgi:hypothetical protein
MTIPFFAHCLLKLVEGGSMTAKEVEGIERLKQEVKKLESKPVKEKESKPVKEKASKRTERHIELPDGTDIYTSVAGREFVCSWNQEDQSYTMDDKTYTSPTAWVKACIVLEKGEAYSINGWAAAYIKNNNKRVYLKNL